MDKMQRMALERARKGWGVGWEKLTDDHREALLAREVLFILVGQCDSLEKFAAGKELVRKAMGWKA